MKILVTGAAGFVAGYLIDELLRHGHEIVGIDNFQKYGRVEKSYADHPAYRFVEGDVKDIDLLKELLADCDQLVAGAAIIGGISLFHAYAYDLLAENERIMASTFDAALWAARERRLRKINVISSSMVYENTSTYPTTEGEQLRCPAPSSTYGFQKLACEYYAKGAWEQYRLPYTIIRPFNCVGTGEKRALCDSEILSGNIRLAMSHVVPDLVQKILKGQDPVHLLGDGSQVRHFTYAGDLAEGIRLCIEKEEALNEDFNISIGVSTRIVDLAALIWRKINGDKPFRWVSDEPFQYDVAKRVPSVEKARNLLGFAATTSLEESLDEVIPWVAEQIRLGTI
ncbi:MAG: NAD(P)-dependent oxidoreductase [Proteobacteria bacterium]|nr:NAD(P)-dependent oxidoreductase [Pseudomonadota bacterium]MBU1738355.1 NAD(P)-dependent oxidoreductase [Pseudomonadota bacterium]